MLTHPTLDQLRALKLDGMVQAFIELAAQEEVRNLAHAEWLALLLDREAADRNTRRFQTRLRAARLRHSQAAIEDVDYRTPRRLDKALFQQLGTCRWIAEHRGLLVTGPCGIGKWWLSCALAQKACRDGYTVHYARVPRLFADLDLAHGDGRFARLFRMLVKVDLLVLDDWGPDRLSASQRRDLMEIVEDPHGRGSMLITTQLPVTTWHEVIGEPTLGDAILDRIVHNAYRLELDGPSMRKIKASEATEPAASPVATLAADWGYTDVVDADLSKYFDTIPHSELMKSVARRVVDRNVLRLIKMWLRAPIEERDADGARRMSGGKGNTRGTPQGGVASPLLANIYMNRFLKHWRLTRCNDTFHAHVVSYADDFVILSRGRAAEALAWTKAVMTKLGLTINEAKTSLRNARQERFDFLGYSFGAHRFEANGNWYLGASPSKKSVQRLKTRIGDLLVPSNIDPWPEVCDKLNRSLRGWSNYFGYDSV